MKRPLEKEKEKARGAAFTCAAIDDLHPSLAHHLHSNTIQSARFDPDQGKYEFVKFNKTISCGGLIQTMRYKYYPNYKDNRSKRKWQSVKIKGSSATQGKRVDSEVAASIEGNLPKKPHKMTKALLAYWQSEGHQLQAAQVPVEVILSGANIKMTQADLIARDAQGRLWLYEIKTGAPVGFYQKQGKFLGVLSEVDCTKQNIWHLQLLHTRLALEAAGVEIFQSRIIQIYEERGSPELQIKLHEPPEWTRLVPPLPKLMVPLVIGGQKKKKQKL